MADGIKIKVNGVPVEADAVEGHYAEGYRDTVNFITDDFGDLPGSGQISADGVETIVDGPNREFQIRLGGARRVHASEHAASGNDPITFALDPAAYPTAYGIYSSRPSSEQSSLYFAIEGVLYVDRDPWQACGQVIQVGTIGSRPAFGVPDRLYWSSDEHILYRDTGSAWVKLAVADYADLDSRSHLLADNTGLGPDHTISGASANQCLRASSSSAAAFSSGVLDNNARVEASHNTSSVGTRRELDFTDSDTVTWGITDVSISEKVTVEAFTYRNVIRLGSDVASTASTSFQNITGLSFSMTSGVNYCVVARLLYTASANTIGLRVSYTGPTMTHQVYTTRTTPGGTTGGVPAAGTDIEFVNVQIAADTGTTSGASVSTATGNMLVFEGLFRPSANGTFQLRFAPETATASGIVIEAGSVLEWF